MPAAEDTWAKVIKTNATSPPLPIAMGYSAHCVRVGRDEVVVGRMPQTAYGKPMQVPTLASKLGMAPHLSLLRWVARKHGLATETDLLDEAVARGCFHFMRAAKPPVIRVAEADLSYEALAVAMLSVANPWDQWLIRAGAMLLSHPENDVHRLAVYARWERCESIVRSVAESGARYEPMNPFWKELLDLLPDAVDCPDGVLPHHSRYVSIPGKIGPGKMGSPVWLRPKQVSALGYAA